MHNLTDLEYFCLIAGSTLVTFVIGKCIFAIMDEHDRKQRLGTVIHLDPDPECLNPPLRSEEQEIRELMWREDFDVSGGKVFCTECMTTGTPICGQCSNSGALARCQAFYDQRK